jgi:hypothetical protein
MALVSVFPSVSLRGLVVGAIHLLFDCVCGAFRVFCLSFHVVRSFGRRPVPTALFGLLREGRDLLGGLGDFLGTRFECVGGVG